jgi:pSer/pThr/pTyr-binding forkhead associated (FHA) protein
MLKLVYKIEGRKNEIPIDREVIIGRKPSCDLYLPDSSISKEHARCYIEGGRAYVEDLGSRNGTMLNGEIIERAAIGPGDRLRVGKVKLKVVEVAEGVSDGEDRDLRGTAAEKVEPEAEEPEESERKPQLEIVAGEGRGEVFPMERDRITLGSKAANDIVLIGEGISRYHAEIFSEKGDWYVKDLGSRNGTFINNDKVGEGKLKSGDVVQIGTVKLLFSIEEPGKKGAEADFGSLLGKESLKKIAAGVIVVLVLLVAYATFFAKKKPGPKPGDGGTQRPVVSAGYEQRLKEGIRFLNDGNYDKAQDCFDRARDSYAEGKLPQLFYDMAEIWRQRRRIFSFKWQEAEKLLVAIDKARKAELGARGMTRPEQLRTDPILRFARRQLKRVRLEVKSVEAFVLANQMQGEAAKLEKKEQPVKARLQYQEALQKLESIPKDSEFSKTALSRIELIRGKIRLLFEAEGDNLCKEESPDWLKVIEAYNQALAHNRSSTYAAQLKEKISQCWINYESENLYNRGYDLLLKGDKAFKAKKYQEGIVHFGKAKEILGKIKLGSRFYDDAKGLIQWVNNQLKIREAKNYFVKGDGERALVLLTEILKEKSLTENNRRFVKRYKDLIEKVVKNFNRGRAAYQKRDYATAIQAMSEVLSLEKNAQNYYRDKAEKIVTFSKESASGVLEQTYKKALHAFETGNYGEALKIFREIKRYGRRNKYFVKLQKKVKTRSKELLHYAKYDIQFRLKRHLFQKAADIYDLLIEMLPSNDPIRKEAIEARKNLR